MVCWQHFLCVTLYFANRIPLVVMGQESFFFTFALVCHHFSLFLVLVLSLSNLFCCHNVNGIFNVERSTKCILTSKFNKTSSMGFVILIFHCSNLYLCCCSVPVWLKPLVASQSWKPKIKIAFAMTGERSEGIYGLVVDAQVYACRCFGNDVDTVCISFLFIGVERSW